MMQSSWLTIDRASAIPRHRQVYDAIRSAILSGRVQAGERLPATRRLAHELAVSRMTVAEAYDQLQAEGYVRGRQGSGTYVAPSLPSGGLSGDGRRAVPKTLAPPRRLSAWGRRVLATPAEPEHAARPLYDFRPNRVAPDRFSWDAWRASVERALAQDRARLLVYPPTGGHPDLRAAIAEHVVRYRSVSCLADQVVIVSGTQMALNLLAQLCLDAGDSVAVEDPGYPAARLSLEARGLLIARIPVDDEGICTDTVAASGPHRLIHVTPSHQHPTGVTLSLSRRLALLEIAAAGGSLIVEDDYDSEYRYEGRPVESLQGLDRHGLVVYAGTFSKSLLPGLRIGFLVLPEHLVEPFLRAKALWDGGTAMLEQAALAQFIRSGEYERHIRRMRRLYRRRRDALVSALEEQFGNAVSIGARHGGLSVMVTLDLADTEDVLAARAAAAGIELRPASRYWSKPPARPTFLLGFAGMPEEAIRAGVLRLARIFLAAVPQ
jgi:GntR family transcriptional regulator/MocR family aminotransferase